MVDPFISSKIETLCIGDSTALEVLTKPKWAQTLRSSFFITGLTISDLIRWADILQCNPHLKCVVFHVGVNVFIQSSVTSSTWDNMINNLGIITSSMNPAKGRHQLNFNSWNNNNAHLSCAHQRPERSHDTY